MKYLRWSPMLDVNFETMTSPPPEKKPRKIVSKEELMKLPREELATKLAELLIYVDDLELKLVRNSNNLTIGGAGGGGNLKKIHHQNNASDVDSSDKHSSGVVNNCAAIVATSGDGISQEERFRQQQLEASRRENVLVMRLTTKEQEVQDLLAQLEEMRAGAGNGVKNMLLDPAVNAMFQHMKRELQQTKEKLNQTLQELEAWKFTPDSKMGKRLIAKCNTLIKENYELGAQTSSGRIGKIENELSVSKRTCEDLKKSQSEIDNFLLDLDEEMEGMQTQIVVLQRKHSEPTNVETVNGCNLNV